MPVNKFKIANLREYLNTLYEEKKERNTRYSVRAWAKHLGYNSAAFLGQVMKGERSANMSLLLKIRDTEEMDDKSWRHLKILYLKSLYNDRDDLIFEDLLLPLNTLDFDINIEKFELLSNWYNLVIFELAKQQSFSLDSSLIKKALEFDISEDQVNEAFTLLKDLKMIDKSGRRTTQGQVGIVTTNNDDETQASVNQAIENKTNEAIRTHHKDFIKLASQAIDEQPTEKRFLSSATVTISEDDLEQINNILEEAHMRIMSLPKKNKSSSIYQLNTQLFKVADITKLN